MPFVFLLFNCKSSLHIPGTRPLTRLVTCKHFSHSPDGPLTFSGVSFDAHEVVILKPGPFYPLVCGFVAVSSVYRVQERPSIPSLLSIHIVRDVGFCQRIALCLSRWSCGFDVVVPLNDFHALGQPCIPEINPAISWCMTLFTCPRVWFSSILSKNFAPTFIQNIGL